MVNILIVDDHQVLLDGLKALLENEPNLNLAFEALNGQTAIEIACNNDVDVILLDINLPDISGFKVCEKIKAKKNHIRIIALTMHDESYHIMKMVKSGADGYLLKNTRKEELLKAINMVINGERYFNEEVKNRLVMGQLTPKKPKISDFIQKLTRREKEILQLIVDELTNDQIAAKLFIASSTVITHRKSLLRKLNAKNTAGLVKKAYEFGLL